MQNYQVILLGSIDQRRVELTQKLQNEILALGMSESEFKFIDSTNLDDYNQKKPAIAVYFGSDTVCDLPTLEKLIEDSVVIVPVVSDKKKVSKEIPEILQNINVVEIDPEKPNLLRLASLVFETFRLLRKERGLFISYRRKGSQPLANRLYDELDKRGFDVFIDTRSVPPGIDFQSELWHRMSDVDIVVLIDTPGFREGRWTGLELAQANCFLSAYFTYYGLAKKKTQILRLVSFFRCGIAISPMEKLGVAQESVRQHLLAFVI